MGWRWHDRQVDEKREGDRAPTAASMIALAIGAAIWLGAIYFALSLNYSSAGISRKRPPQFGDHWLSCGEAKAAGTIPIHRGEPVYSRSLDPDGDGIACQPMAAQWRLQNHEFLVILRSATARSGQPLHLHGRHKMIYPQTLPVRLLPSRFFLHACIGMGHISMMGRKNHYDRRSERRNGQSDRYQIFAVLLFLSLMGMSVDAALRHPARAARQPQPGDHWRGCDDARAADVTPIYEGEPGYREDMDGNGDGIACEPKAMPNA